MKLSRWIALFLPMLAAAAGTLITRSQIRKGGGASPRMRLVGWALMMLGIAALVVLLLTLLPE